MTFSSLSSSTSDNYKHVGRTDKLYSILIKLKSNPASGIQGEYQTVSLKKYFYQGLYSKDLPGQHSMLSMLGIIQGIS